VPRIVAGFAGGRRLAVPPGRGTRPTADRVKEALFSRLAADPGLAGARVLDLFAGAGGLGLEAGSRGAAAVTLVENDPAALRALRANVRVVEAAAGADDRPEITVVAERVERLLSRPPAAGFDIALLDPPYAVDVGPILTALAGGSWLRPGATVVAERSARDPALTWPDGLSGDADRRYGEVRLCYGHRA